MVALPEPLHRLPPFERHGMGWIFRPSYAPACLTFDRLVDRKDELTAEIHVTTKIGRHLIRRRLNLLGSRSHSDLARELGDIDGCENVQWKRVIAEGCESTIEAFRAGSPVIEVEGEIERPAPIRWQCEKLVLANSVNCWVAAASTGKSTFLKAYALHHALGVPFLGRAMTQGVPLYIDYEDTEENFRRTLFQVAGGLGVRHIPKVLWKRGDGPLKGQVYRLAEMITQYGITLLCIDAVAAAGGDLGDKGYEAVALDVEQALLALPPVTIILLDHVTGDELKSGVMPRKARGSSRKYEFIRYQWTLGADMEEARLGNHVVGWNHTKTNLTALQPPFAVRIVHEDERIGFAKADATEVTQIAEQMPLYERILHELKRQNGPMSIFDLTMVIYGQTDKKKEETVRATLNRKKDSRMALRIPDGRWALREFLDTQTIFKDDVPPEAEEDDPLICPF